MACRILCVNAKETAGYVWLTVVQVTIVIDSMAAISVWEKPVNKMAKKTTTERADKTDKPEKGSTSGEKGAGDKTPVENAKENEEQPVELGEQMYCGVHDLNFQYF